MSIAQVMFAVCVLWEIALVAVLARRTTRWTAATMLLSFVLTALVYDNVMISLGSTLGEGEPLLTLSYPRHVLHVMAGGILPIVGMLLIVQAGIASLDRPAIKGGQVLLALALFGWAVTSHLVGLQLAPTWEQGMLSYNSANAKAPMFIILATVHLIFVGIALGRAGFGWKLPLSGVAMLVLGGLQPVLGTGFTNLGEAFFSYGLVAAALAVQPQAEPLPDAVETH